MDFTSIDEGRPAADCVWRVVTMRLRPLGFPSHRRGDRERYKRTHFICMATQRITLAKVGGMAGQSIEGLFQHWISVDELQPELDRFAQALRNAGCLPPTLYFCEWVDCWSMGYGLPRLGDERAPVVRGEKFEASCFRFPVSLRAPTLGDEPTQETKWLAARLREAEDAWAKLFGCGSRFPPRSLGTDSDGQCGNGGAGSFTGVAQDNRETQP